MDYASPVAPAWDASGAHANAAALYARRRIALAPKQAAGPQKPSRADRLKRRANLPPPEAGAGGRTSLKYDGGSSDEKTTRKKPRASPQTRDAALLIERAAPIRVSQHNPKKGKSAERYEAYKAATTAREYVALGGSKADLKYDIQRGYVTVLPPPAGAKGAPMVPAAPTGPRPSPAGAPAVAAAAGSPGSASASVSATARPPPTLSTDPVSYLPETPVWPAEDDAAPARADGPGSSMPPAAKS